MQIPQRRIVPGIVHDLARHKMVFISGPRQSEKTTLAKQLIKAKDEYYNWDIRLLLNSVSIMRVNCLKILRKNGKNDARNSWAIFCAHFYRFYLSFQPFNPLTTKLNSKEVYC